MECKTLKLVKKSFPSAPVVRRVFLCSFLRGFVFIFTDTEWEAGVFQEIMKILFFNRFLREIDNLCFPLKVKNNHLDLVLLIFVLIVSGQSLVLVLFVRNNIATLGLCMIFSKHLIPALSLWSVIGQNYGGRWLWLAG